MYLCRIYKLCNAIDDKEYVGSTKNDLGKRFSQHKCRVKKGSKRRVHEYMRELGIDKFYIELLEEKQVNTRQQQLKLETQWHVKLNSELNQIRAYTSKEQAKSDKAIYHADHREKLNIISKDYYNENKEELNQKAKEYRAEHKEKIKEQKKGYYSDHKEEINQKHKEYRVEHKEKIKEQRKGFRAEHKQEISQKAKIKVDCECGTRVRKADIRRHKRSKKHIAYLERSD